MKNSVSQDEAILVIEKFESLPLERRVEIFRELSSQAREQLVETIARPTEITRKVAEEEMYVSIKELGEQNAPALVALTTGRQLLYALDVDLWKKDMFDRRAAGHWLEVLASIGEEKVLQFVQVADPELILTALASFVRVELRNPDVDLLEQQDYLPSFTLDDTFFVEFRTPDLEGPVKMLLDSIFRWDYDYYRNLMQRLLMGASSEDEEMARKWKRARLADKGFPDFDEAIEIYRYLSKSSLNGPLAEPAAESPGRPAEVGPVLAYPLRVIDSQTLFRKCLDEVSDPEERDRLSVELAHTANKVMVADGRDPSSIEEVHGSLRKVGGYVNIALEDMCGEDLAEATRVLRANHVEFLFRRGFSLILDLRKQAHRLIRGYQGGVENLGYPLAGIVEGLLRQRPIYAGNLLGKQKVTEFEHIEEIEGIRQMMDQKTIEDNWEPI